MKKLLLILFSAIAIGVSLPACNDDVQLIPEVAVDFTVSLDLPQFDPLQVDGGWVYLDQANGNVAGYRGIVLYKISGNSYRAMDRACSYLPLEACHKLVVDDADTHLNCECGDSKFNWDGSLLNPPASRSLKIYSTLYSPTNNSLRIFNGR